LPDGFDERIVISLVHEHADDRQLAVPILMNEVKLHVSQTAV
jgi:hypothetical protein